MDLQARSHGCHAFPRAWSACAHSKEGSKPSEAAPLAALPKGLAPDQELGTHELGSRTDRGQAHHFMPIPAAAGCPQPRRAKSFSSGLLNLTEHTNPSGEWQSSPHGSFTVTVPTRLSPNPGQVSYLPCDRL